jgi:hypothetical protein
MTRHAVCCRLGILDVGAVGSADPAGFNRDQDFAGSRRGNGPFDKRQAAGFFDLDGAIRFFHAAMFSF